MIINLVKDALPNNTNLEMNIMIYSIADAIGRGGEVKFQNYNDWSFDYLLELTNTGWQESKTVKG